MFGLLLLLAAIVLPSVVIPFAAYFVLRALRRRPVFDRAWTGSLVLCIVWVGAAMLVFRYMAQHQDRERHVGIPDGLDQLVLWVKWLAMLLPSFPTLLAMVAARRAALSVRDSLAGVAIIALLISSAMGYWRSQRSPQRLANEKWWALGATAEYGPDRKVTSLSFAFARRGKSVSLKLLEGQDSLRILRCGSNTSGDELRYLRYVPNLIELSVNGERCEDRDLKNLRFVPKLGSLRLSGGFTNQAMDAVAELKELWKLDIRGTKVDDDGLKAISRMPSLAVLRVDRLDLTDRGVEHLASLDKLTHLHATGTRITGSGFCAGGFKSLELVTLNDCPIDDAGLRCIVELPKLERADIDQTNVSEAFVKQLRREFEIRGKRIDIRGP